MIDMYHEDTQIVVKQVSDINEFLLNLLEEKTLNLVVALTFIS
jgi:hypothetical protein